MCSRGAAIPRLHATPQFSASGAQAACRARNDVALVSTFTDQPYHRSSFCLASPSIEHVGVHGTGACLQCTERAVPAFDDLLLQLLAACIPSHKACDRLLPAQLAAAAVNLARQALAAVDMRAHDATHPRLGAVDHISCHPLGADATLQHAAEVARRIGQQLAVPPTSLPVYLYGSAHPEGRTLADIRRELGYFQPAGGAQQTVVQPQASSRHQPGRAESQRGSQHWRGSATAVALSSYPPDLGPHAAAAASGVLAAGAIPWLVNFNVQLGAGASLAAAKRIARAVSERGGGLPAVQVRCCWLGSGGDLSRLPATLDRPHMHRVQPTGSVHRLLQVMGRAQASAPQRIAGHGLGA